MSIVLSYKAILATASISLLQRIIRNWEFRLLRVTGDVNIACIVHRARPGNVKPWATEIGRGYDCRRRGGRCAHGVTLGKRTADRRGSGCGIVADGPAVRCRHARNGMEDGV